MTKHGFRKSANPSPWRKSRRRTQRRGTPRRSAAETGGPGQERLASVLSLAALFHGCVSAATPPERMAARSGGLLQKSLSFFPRLASFTSQAERRDSQGRLASQSGRTDPQRLAAFPPLAASSQGSVSPPGARHGLGGRRTHRRTRTHGRFFRFHPKNRCLVAGEVNVAVVVIRVDCGRSSRKLSITNLLPNVIDPSSMECKRWRSGPEAGATLRVNHECTEDYIESSTQVSVQHKDKTTESSRHNNQ